MLAKRQNKLPEKVIDKRSVKDGTGITQI